MGVADEPAPIVSAGVLEMNDQRYLDRAYVDVLYMRTTEVTQKGVREFVDATGYVRRAKKMPTRKRVKHAGAGAVSATRARRIGTIWMRGSSFAAESSLALSRPRISESFVSLSSRCRGCGMSFVWVFVAIGYGCPATCEGSHRGDESACGRLLSL